MRNKNLIVDTFLTLIMSLQPYIFLIDIKLNKKANK
jgi:hypothetical protein